jgi:hypothetical protein
MLRKAIAGLVVLVAVLLAGLYLLGSGLLGEDWGPGRVTAPAVEAARVEQREAAQRDAALEAGVPRPRQILFGDLHVHSTFSTDAFLMALSLSGGQGAHPVSDACDFARHCSALDFWSINDHAASIRPRQWRETVDALRQCNARAEDPGNPDSVAFLGWEWTQVGTHPGNHYGHKNVVLRDLDEASVPARPIAALPPADALDRQLAKPSPFALGFLPLMQRSRESLDLVRYLRGLMATPSCPDGVPVRELPGDCREWAETPSQLFAKLDDWGFESLVIPHGTTWGFYTPMGSSWEGKLERGLHDPERETLIEVFSGHGNSEEFRAWREVLLAPDGTRSCPEPAPSYLPSCWRAGEIIRQRCLTAGEDEATCERRAATARQHYVDADLSGHRTVPGARVADWLDAGQCSDCFQPSFNYRPRSSVQYILALRSFADPGSPRRFRFGFLASSDNHSARPGTGYKEYARVEMTEARLTRAAAAILGDAPPQSPEPVSRAFDREANAGRFFGNREAERAASFFLTGGLVAVHSEGRSRQAIWQALRRREVYGTSGPRILLWFDLLNPPGTRGQRVAMGGEAALDASPIFQVRAVGSFEQKPGCPEDAARALGAERTAYLCQGECYHPSDRRRRIARIEVVRIRPQARRGEPVEGLIDDPWRVLPCDGDPAGCTHTFSDPEFATGGRDVLYYVRAVEEPSPAVNAGLLRCRRDDAGRCVDLDPCIDVAADDDCLQDTQERAWSSPIFIQHAAGGPAPDGG